MNQPDQFEVAKRLQAHYDGEFGLGAVSVALGGFGIYYAYTHRKGLVIVKPEWLDGEIVVRYMGKPKIYKTN